MINNNAIFGIEADCGGGACYASSQGVVDSCASNTNQIGGYVMKSSENDTTEVQQTISTDDANEESAEKKDDE